MDALLFALAALVPQDLSSEEAYARLAGVERITPVVKVVQAVSPAVVFIETESTKRVRSWFGEWDRVDSGSGSGVVVRSDGYIVTNYHVVRGARRIRVSFEGDTQPYEAELKSFVQSEDLALLKIVHPDPSFPVVRMGTSSDLWPGEQVIAIGNPYGQTYTVSTGIISGLHRDVEMPEQKLRFDDLIQTDASINFGNSGGPLLNIRGELIGINTAMNRQAENIGFAIPVDRVREVLNDILYPQAKKSWLGFTLAEGSPMVVDRVWPESPAALAGICEGDRIVAIGGDPIATADEFLHKSLELEPDSEVLVEFARAGARGEAKLTTWDRLDGLLFERLGLTVRTAYFGDRAGVLVDQVRSGGPADAIALRKGDWIGAVRPAGSAYRPVYFQSAQQFADYLARVQPETTLDIDIYRDYNENGAYELREELYKGSITVD